MRWLFAFMVAMLVCLGAMAQGMPGGKQGMGDAPPAAAAPQQAPVSRARCAQPLMEGCMRMQSSCQMACPGLWSRNPSAPAFAPTDRAGCLARCGSQHRMCMIQYGCM